MTPRLTLVPTPRGLTAEGRQLWRQLTAERITDGPQQRLLQSGLRCLALAERLRAILLTIEEETASDPERDPGWQQMDRLVADEIAARQAFVAHWVALGLTPAGPVDARRKRVKS